MCLHPRPPRVLRTLTLPDWQLSYLPATLPQVRLSRPIPFPIPHALPPPAQVRAETAAAAKAEAAREREEAAIRGFEQAVEARQAEVQHVDTEIEVVQQRLGELQDLRALVSRLFRSSGVGKLHSGSRGDG